MQQDFRQYADEVIRSIAEDQQAGEQENNAPVLSVISAVDLQVKEIPPVKFAVEGLLPAGLNMIAAPSKYGKSWMVLDMCLSVAAGRRFLGYATNKTGCLYLALEDSERRLKSRMNKVLADRPAPTGFYYATSAHDMDNGLFDELEGFLRVHPDTGLIVIDTFQKVRGAVHGREGAYAGDYREMSRLKTFADSHALALLLVHHLRKMLDPGDPFAMISGTTGIMAAGDTTLVLTKESRNAETATLSVTGRDVESSETVLKFNTDTCRWVNLGNADDYAEQQAIAEYQQSPVVLTVKRLLSQSPDRKWSGTAAKLIEAGRLIAKTTIATSPRELSDKLKNMDKPMFEIDGIVHERKKNGSGGGVHTFYYQSDVVFEEIEQEEMGQF